MWVVIHQDYAACFEDWFMIFETKEKAFSYFKKQIDKVSHGEEVVIKHIEDNDCYYLEDLNVYDDAIIRISCMPISYEMQVDL